MGIKDSELKHPETNNTKEGDQKVGENEKPSSGAVRRSESGGNNPEGEGPFP